MGLVLLIWIRILRVAAGSFSSHSSTRKILIHINNTNPILDETSAERAELRRRGIEVAWDGMEIVL